jgi:hypothetical protein
MNKYAAATTILLLWIVTTFVFLVNFHLSGRYLAICNICIYIGSLIALWNDKDA